MAIAIDDLTIPAAVYSVGMLITGGLFARTMAQRNRAGTLPGVGVAR